MAIPNQKLNGPYNYFLSKGSPREIFYFSNIRTRFDGSANRVAILARQQDTIHTVSLLEVECVMLGIILQLSIGL